MEDPWRSVEAMLRWKLAQVRQRIDKAAAFHQEAVDLYPLPASADVTPDGWSFGTLTTAQVSAAEARHGLGWARHQVEKAEAAITAGDLPTAVHWTITAIETVWSAGSLWNSAQAVRVHRYVDGTRAKRARINAETNAARAKYDRAERDAWSAEYERLKADYARARVRLTLHHAAELIAEKRGLSSRAVGSIKLALKRQSTDS